MLRFPAMRAFSLGPSSVPALHAAAGGGAPGSRIWSVREARASARLPVERHRCARTAPGRARSRCRCAASFGARVARDRVDFLAWSRLSRRLLKTTVDSTRGRPASAALQRLDRVGEARRVGLAGDRRDVGQFRRHEAVEGGWEMPRLDAPEGRQPERSVPGLEERVVVGHAATISAKLPRAEGMPGKIFCSALSSSRKWRSRIAASGCRKSVVTARSRPWILRRAEPRPPRRSPPWDRAAQHPDDVAVAVIGAAVAVLVDRAAEFGDHRDDRVVPVRPQPVCQGREAGAERLHAASWLLAAWRACVSQPPRLTKTRRMCLSWATSCASRSAIAMWPGPAARRYRPSSAPRCPCRRQAGYARRAPGDRSRSAGRCRHRACRRRSGFPAGRSPSAAPPSPRAADWRPLPGP